MTRFLNFSPVWLLLFFTLLFFSCTRSDKILLTGNIDYIGSSEIFVEKQPLHYKYSSKIRYPVRTDENGNFEMEIPGSKHEIAYLTIDDTSYPVLLLPGKTVDITVRRAYFPDSVSVDGYSQNWNELYQRYLEKTKKLCESIEEKLPDFKDGKETDILDLYEDRKFLAKRYLGDTPLDLYYHKAIGEYLVKRLENITYNRNDPGMNPEVQRKEIIADAKKMNFFAFEVLQDQRAGIRDFTNAYANTFGVEERIEEQYGQDLMQYDIKRLGYKTLDSARTAVLKHIEERRALAYAKMHLIAERIGEMSPEIAEQSYRSFLNEYSDFPEYTSFLKSFHGKIEEVSPGNPAKPFTLPNKEGEMVSLSDFRGSYVLLDFWAVWCIPCLDEFPHMREMYNNYSRDDFEIVAISIEEDSLVWRDAIDRFENPWVQLYGGNGFQQKTFKAFQGGGIPFYILVDREGNIERYNDIRPSFNLPKVLDSLITNESTY